MAPVRHMSLEDLGTVISKVVGAKDWGCSSELQPSRRSYEKRPSYGDIKPLRPIRRAFNEMQSPTMTSTMSVFEFGDQSPTMPTRRAGPEESFKDLDYTPVPELPRVSSDLKQHIAALA
jgi:hypothetical protein